MGHKTIWSGREWRPEVTENAAKSYQFWRSIVCCGIPGWTSHSRVCIVIGSIFLIRHTHADTLVFFLFSFVSCLRLDCISASSDNIRLWNASEGADSDMTGKTRSGVPFKIIPGHHGGIISQMGAYLFFLFLLKKILFYFIMDYIIIIITITLRAWHGMAWHVRVNRKLFLVCGGV